MASIAVRELQAVSTSLYVLQVAMIKRRLRKVAKHFASRTGIHSMASISEARSNFRRVLWSFVLLTALAVYVYQLREMAIKYFSHPVKTTTTIEYKMPMEFPAVTVCNLNPFKASKLRDKAFQNEYRKSTTKKPRKAKTSTADPKHTRSPSGTKVPPQSTTTKFQYFIPTGSSDAEEVLFISGDVLEWPGIRNSSATTYSREEDEAVAFDGLIDIIDTKPSVLVESSNWTTRETSGMRSDTLVQRRLLFFMNSIEKNLRNKLTYDFNDLLIDCSFDGRNCVPNDFIRLSNPKYGSCFVFNAGRNSSMHHVPIRHINSSGADVGLELTLFVDQKNYIPEAASEAGYKIVIHEAIHPPIPEKDGYVVSPGHFTALGIKLNLYERAPWPYGNCKNFSEHDNQHLNMFLTQLPMTRPTLSSCMKTCEQLEIIKKCRCYSLLHGFDDSQAFDEVRDPDSYLPACYMERDAADFLCLSDVMRKVAAGQLPCKSEFCKQNECEHAVFKTSTSTAAWPAENGFERIRAIINRHPNPIIRVLLNQSREQGPVQEKLFFDSNFLKVKVFFEDLTVLRLKTEPSYGIHELLSEIGGQGGLWLGVSLITMFELFELVTDMLLICLWKTTPSRPRSNVELRNGV